MDGSQPPLWMVAMTLPSRERRVVVELREAGLNAVWPRVLEREIVGGARRKWRGRERTIVVEKSVLPNYVLMSGPGWQQALDVDGVTLVLRMGGSPQKPATLPHEAAQWLCGPNGDGIVEDRSATKIAAVRRFIIGQSVRIESDLWLHDISEGTVISISKGRAWIENEEGRRISAPVDVLQATP